MDSDRSQKIIGEIVNTMDQQNKNIENLTSKLEVMGLAVAARPTKKNTLKWIAIAAIIIIFFVSAIGVVMINQNRKIKTQGVQIQSSLDASKKRGVANRETLDKLEALSVNIDKATDPGNPDSISGQIGQSIGAAVNEQRHLFVCETQAENDKLLEAMDIDEYTISDECQKLLAAAD